MEAKLALCLILAIVSAEWYGVESFSGGASPAACSTISPDPAEHRAQPQSSPVPYNIDISQLSDAGGYTPGQTYSLSLSGNSGEQFRGLLVLSRTAADDSPVGTFTVTDTANTEPSSCSPANSGITHSDNNDKISVSFQWTAPPQGTGPIQFRFAVVQVRATYWADQSTAVVQELVAPTEATTTAAGVTSTASTDAQPSTMMTTDAQSSTMMATDAQPSTMMTTDAQSSTMMTTDAQPSTMMTTDAQPSTMMTTDAQSSTMMTTDAQSSTMMTTDAQSSTMMTTDAQSSTMMTTDAQPSTMMTTDAQSSTMMTTDAQSSTMMATDTRDTSTSAGQPGETTNMQGGGTSTVAEPAQTVPRSSAMKQSGVGFWTSILLIVMVSKAIMRIL